MLGYGVAAALATVLGLAGGAVDAAWLKAADRLILTPLFDALAAVLGTFAGLSVFFTVISGVCGIGDTADFERTGKRMLGRFIGLTFLWPMLGCAALATVCFSCNFVTARTERGLARCSGCWATGPGACGSGRSSAT